jgi:anti-sigma B factor antagonist
MATSKLTIDEREAGDVTTVVLTGEITLDDGDLAMRKCIHDLVDRGRIKVLLDLGGVTYIDSAGIGMVAAKLKTLRDLGGDMKLVNLNTRGQRLFGMTKLLMNFETFDNEEQAVRSFQFKAR